MLFLAVPAVNLNFQVKRIYSKTHCRIQRVPCKLQRKHSGELTLFPKSGLKQSRLKGIVPARST